MPRKRPLDVQGEQFTEGTALWRQTELNALLECYQ